MDFGPLAVVVAAGLLGPLLASAHRFAPPVVVGQIVAGVVIGRTGFDWIDPADPVLEGLAAIGFALLMFIVGTHLPVRDARLRVAAVAGIGLAVTAMAAGVIGGVLLAPVVGLDRPAVLAVLLATSSAAVALPVIQGLPADGRPALVMTVWIAVVDVATMLALPFVLATGRASRAVVGVALVVAFGVAAYLAAVVVRRRGGVRRLRHLSHERGWGLDLRISLLALFVAAWVASRFGSSILIAGFTVGVVVALLGQPRRVAQQLIGLGEGFLVPLFFVHLGAQLDVRALASSPPAIRLGLGLAAASIAVHVGAAFVWRLPAAAGLVASAQLGVPAAVVSIGLSTQQVTAAQGAAILGSVLVTLAACAVGGALLGHRGRLTDASAPSGERPSSAPPER